MSMSILHHHLAVPAVEMQAEALFVVEKEERAAVLRRQDHTAGQYLRPEMVKTRISSPEKVHF